MGKNCCFTGHRPEKLGLSQERVEAALKREIHRAVGEGYTTFLTGMSRGVDLWAARLVLEERRAAPEIRLVCAVPYRGFSDRWSAPWRRLYREVLEQAAEARVFFPSFSYRAFAVRNRWMVDRADRVIAVYTAVPAARSRPFAMPGGEGWRWCCWAILIHDYVIYTGKFLSI